MVEVNVVHPIISHFPVALLFITPMGLVIWSHLQNRSWHAATITTALGGAVSATLAWMTGPALIPYGKNPEIMDIVLPHHQRMGTATMILSWLVVILLVRTYFTADYDSDIPNFQRVPYWSRFWLITLAAVTGALAAYTAHLGAQMVWGELSSLSAS